MRIPIPDTFRLGPYDINVKQYADGVLARIGHYVPYFKAIQLEESRDEDMKTETFIHEIIEAIDHIYEVELQHKQITVLGAVLAQVLRDLPEPLPMVDMGTSDKIDPGFSIAVSKDEGDQRQ